MTKNGLYAYVACCFATVPLAGCGGSAGSVQQGPIPQEAAYVQHASADRSTGNLTIEPIGAPPLPAIPLALGTRTSPDLTSPILGDSGSYAGGPIIVGSNTGAAGTGVEGVSGPAGGYGLVGLSQNTGASGSNVGVYGKATGPHASGVYGYSTQDVGVYGVSNNASSYGGYFYNVAGAGSVGLKAVGNAAAVLGASAHGSGVVGETTFPSGTPMEPFPKLVASAGVRGVDASTDGGLYDAGVSGTTKTGFGIAGAASGSGGIGLQGVANGFEGYGLYAASSGSDGVGAFGADESDSSGAVGVLASSYINTALYASSQSGPAIVTNNGEEDTMSVDSQGNVIVLGNLTVDGSIAQHSTTKPAISSPGRGEQIESVGDSRLSGGSAYVRIDPQFQEQLAPSAPYHVFITPDGDCRGLYVTGKTNAGFTVRELQGGRAGIAFDYRIVGSPRPASLARPIQVRDPRHARPR